MEYVVEMLNIRKEFPGIVANDNITLQLKEGEIHALLGENGAGKSTLMGMLYGAQMQTMMPKLHSTYHEGMQLIRPLYYVKEADIIRWKERNNLDFIQCACKVTEHRNMSNEKNGSKRAEMKKLLKQLRSVYDKVDMNIYNSTKNVNLNTLISYIQDGETHHFMDKY